MRYYWFGAGAALAGLVLLLADRLEAVPFGGLVMGVGMMLAVLLVFLGTRRQPLNLLAFDGRSERLTLRVYNEAAAASLLSVDGAREVAFPAVRRGYVLALAVTALIVLVAIVATRVARST
jgi:hypothetical protein